jgi:hypothetical protein
VVVVVVVVVVQKTFFCLLYILVEKMEGSQHQPIELPVNE